MSKGINELAKNVDNPDDAAGLIKKMDNMIKSKKNNSSKTNNKFKSAVRAFKISKTTISFKIDIVKFIDMYPKMQTSWISLYHLKNNFRVIKEVCQEHASDFQ